MRTRSPDALPTAVRTLALLYNKDILDAAGQKPPTTWEELVSVAQATVAAYERAIEQFASDRKGA